MAYLKTKGIVLKEVYTGEADKIITILSKEHGKMSVFAKGARRPKSRFIACTQFLCYSEFLLFKGQDMYTINGCDVIETFSKLGSDIVKLTYAAHMIDIVYDTIQEGQYSAKELRLLLNTLYFLLNSSKSPDLVTCIFELRYLCILGYAPYIKGCVNCTEDYIENISFSFKKCGFLCNKKECLFEDSSALRLLPGTVKALYHIVFAEINRLFNFNVSKEVLEQLKSITNKYLRERLDKNYKHLDYLKKLKTDI
ncbi:MAG: DNA repair protein RecO [Clostridiaceae bacterium]|jgi:DNA repair protein RecO (recombination protein O)|nr:DNA repair protein RecO [Clostridiaceae bacterium]